MAAVRRVVAPNPGPYTGPGTNTWLLDAGTVTVVIDPGPDDAAHLDAIQRALKGSTVGVVLVTVPTFVDAAHWGVMPSLLGDPGVG